MLLLCLSLCDLQPGSLKLIRWQHSRSKRVPECLPFHDHEAHPPPLPPHLPQHRHRHSHTKRSPSPDQRHNHTLPRYRRRSSRPQRRQSRWRPYPRPFLHIPLALFALFALFVLGLLAFLALLEPKMTKANLIDPSLQKCYLFTGVGACKSNNGVFTHACTESS